MVTQRCSHHLRRQHPISDLSSPLPVLHPDNVPEKLACGLGSLPPVWETLVPGIGLARLRQQWEVNQRMDRRGLCIFLSLCHFAFPINIYQEQLGGHREQCSIQRQQRQEASSSLPFEYRSTIYLFVLYSTSLDACVLPFLSDLQAIKWCQYFILTPQWASYTFSFLFEGLL